MEESKYDEIIINTASFRKLTEEMDHNVTELNKLKLDYDLAKDESVSWHNKYDEESVKNEFLSKKNLELEQSVEHLKKSFVGSEELVQIYKKKYEQLSEHTKTNKVGLINYMRNTTEKISSFQEKIRQLESEKQKYIEVLEKIRPALRICLNDCNSLLLPESLSKDDTCKLSHSVI